MLYTYCVFKSTCNTHVVYDTKQLNVDERDRKIWRERERKRERERERETWGDKWHGGRDIYILIHLPKKEMSALVKCKKNMNTFNIPCEC